MNTKTEDILELIKSGEHIFLPNVSVDSVIFGYDNQELQILLLEASNGNWMLPGGYVKKEEDLDTAALRNVAERIGVKDIFLKQFHTFGQKKRSFHKEIGQLFEDLGESITQNLWIQERFISVAYYTLVNKTITQPKPNFLAKSCRWHNVQQLPNLLLDHENIVTTALDSFRADLASYPLAYHLLPQKFTMPELHAVFQSIYQKRLDRSRFQKKMFEYDVFERLESRVGVAHRRPYLYRHKQTI